MALSFSDEAMQKIAAARSRYPNAQAACLPVIHIAQAEFGYLPDEVIELVASTLELPVAHVHGVVTFYTMFRRRRQPVGENMLMVCTNISCMLRGGYRVLDRISQKLGIQVDETTPDKKFTLIEEECLAACADAPAVICGPRYFLNLDSDEKVDRMLQELAAHPEPEY